MQKVVEQEKLSIEEIERIISESSFSREDLLQMSNLQFSKELTKQNLMISNAVFYKLANDLKIGVVKGFKMMKGTVQASLSKEFGLNESYKKGLSDKLFASLEDPFLKRAFLQETINELLEKGDNIPANLIERHVMLFDERYQEYNDYMLAFGDAYTPLEKRELRNYVKALEHLDMGYNIAKREGCYLNQNRYNLYTAPDYNMVEFDEERIVKK